MTNNTPFRRRAGRIGWAILLVMNILLLLAPANYTPTSLSLQTWLVVMIAFLLLILLGFLVGFILLFVRYMTFFKQFRGTLALLIPLLVGLRVFAWLQTITNPGWPLSQMLLLVPVWLMGLLVTLPIALAVYLWYQDQSIRILGYTLLIIVWSLVFYVNRVGPESLLLEIFRGDALPELMGMLCVGQIAIVLVALFFIGHSLRLIYREWTRADMQLITDRSSESPVE